MWTDVAILQGSHSIRKLVVYVIGNKKFFHHWPLSRGFPQHLVMLGHWTDVTQRWLCKGRSLSAGLAGLYPIFSRQQWLYKRRLWPITLAQLQTLWPGLLSTRRCYLRISKDGIIKGKWVCFENHFLFNKSCLFSIWCWRCCGNGNSFLQFVCSTQYSEN